jgi:hypothetical protein
MLIYELLTGREVRLAPTRGDSPHALGVLLLRSLPPSDWRDAAPLVSLLHVLAQQRLGTGASPAPDEGGATGSGVAETRAALSALLPRYVEITVYL